MGNGVSFKIERDVSRFGIYNSTVVMSVLISGCNTEGLTMDSGYIESNTGRGAR